ncbi:MAG: carbon storage regulator [Pseudomonadota bacterium]
MLTLERKEGEVINITHNGETLDVHVSLLRDNKVKLSFDGPESFEVWREEVSET